jgi:hypothetical protein
MEQVMAHFFSRAMVEERMGVQADWNAVDSLMLKALAAAEKVARYRHAQLSAMRLFGDLNARPENVNVEELLESIRAEWAVLGPLIEVLSFSGDSEVGPSLHEPPPPIEQVATGVVARAQTRGLLRIIRYRSGLIETSASASSGHRMIGKTMALAGQLLVCPTAWNE